MNSRERFETALDRWRPDRVPLAYLFFGGGHAVLDELGLTMKDAYYSPEGIVRAQLKAREMFQHDNVMSPWGCMTIEAEALGSAVDVRDMAYPGISSHAVKEDTDVAHLRVPDPSKDGRMPVVLESLRMLAGEIGHDTIVAGFMCSPFTILDGIRGMSEVGIDMLMKPDMLKKMLEVSTDTCLVYGKAMVDAGAAVILIKDGFAGADMMSREHCREFVIQYLEPVVHSLQEYGARIIVGNVSSQPYLDMQVAAGPDAICFAAGDIAEVKTAFGDKVCIIGNVDQTQMTSWDTDTIEQEARQCIDKAKGNGGYILSTGCEIPLDAPAENTRALYSAVRKYGLY